MVLQDNLEMLEYSIVLARNGEEGLSHFKKQDFDMCILDVMMPRKDGFSLAMDIRKENKLIPIIFLTAKSLKEDRIRGFQTGCDDYIAKPFSTEELSLRIRAILRRCQSGSDGENEEQVKTFELGKYIFDAENMTLNGKDGTRSFTRKEAAMLCILCKNMDKLVARDHILKEVWGDDDYFLGRSMDVFIAKLRKYLRDDPGLSITNVHGAGFKLETK